MTEHIHITERLFAYRIYVSKANSVVFICLHFIHDIKISIMPDAQKFTTNRSHNTKRVHFLVNDILHSPW